MRGFRLALLISLLGMPAGCGREGPPAKLLPVRGQIVYQGAPLPGITVTFIPDDERGLDARATTDGDGRFTLETYPYGTGAMAGRYRVTVLYYSRNDTLPRKYTKFYQTPLTAEVMGAGPNEFVFTLKD